MIKVHNLLNRIEQYISISLDQRPFIKRFVKDAYQALWTLAPTSDRTYGKELSIFDGYFVGFHDICPFSADDSLLLVHRTNGLGAMPPTAIDKVTVGVIDRANQGRFIPLTNTSAFNWQEGSRSQWYGDRIVYNDIAGNGHAGARIIDLKGAAIGHLSIPVSAIHADSNLAVGYDFARLAAYDSAYTYAGAVTIARDAIPEKDGLWLTDLLTGRSWLPVSLRDLANTLPKATMKSAYHYVSHCQFSPSGTVVSFMHCWIKRNLRHSRLITYDIGQSTISAHAGFDWVSHHCWRGDAEIIAYAAAIGLGRRYYRLLIPDGDIHVLGEHAPMCDGHPHMNVDGRLMVTDTYPDRKMNQNLLLYDLASDTTQLLLSLKIPWAYRYSARCDFHPRWDRAGRTICFDSPHRGSRAVCLLDLGSLREN